jgi:hypothetical protein
MINAFFVPANTLLTAKGDSDPVAIESAANRVFLVTLEITEIVEQESLEISIVGSADGQTWAPLLRFPQRFYSGETPILLDLQEKPDVKQLRAHWEVNRWGRGSEKPMFEIGLSLREVAKEMLQASRATA